MLQIAPPMLYHPTSTSAAVLTAALEVGDFQGAHWPGSHVIHVVAPPEELKVFFLNSSGKVVKITAFEPFYLRENYVRQVGDVALFGESSPDILLQTMTQGGQWNDSRRDQCLPLNNMYSIYDSAVPMWQSDHMIILVMWSYMRILLKKEKES